MQATLEQSVCRLVADTFGIPYGEVQPTSSADDIGNWDSLHVIHLVMALESEFGVSISAEETARLLSVPIIIEVLREKGISSAAR